MQKVAERSRRSTTQDAKRWLGINQHPAYLVQKNVEQGWSTIGRLKIVGSISNWIFPSEQIQSHVARYMVSQLAFIPCEIGTHFLLLDINCPFYPPLDQTQQRDSHTCYEIVAKDLPLHLLSYTRAQVKMSSSVPWSWPSVDSTVSSPVSEWVVPELPLNETLAEPKIKRASVACKECRSRRVKVKGPLTLFPSLPCLILFSTQCHDGNPCWECRKRDHPCIIEESSDRRRNASKDKIREDLEFYRTFLCQLLRAIRESNDASLQPIIDTIRSGPSVEEIQTNIISLIYGQEETILFHWQDSCLEVADLWLWYFAFYD